MCLIHEDFRGFQAFSHSSSLVQLDKFEVHNPLRIIH